MQSPFPDLRPFQREALEAFHHHAHTVLIAPTGSGKSLVFQKYLYDTRAFSRAILVAPLNALARQLAEGFKQKGLTVRIGAGVGSDSPPSSSGIWIVSPEKLIGSGLNLAKAWKPNCLVVDEAHCIWEWGERFRPEFAKIPGLVSELRIPKTFWCSATLPKEAFQKIAKELPSDLKKIGKFSLPASLKIERIRVPSHLKLNCLRNRLEHCPGESGMIFVSTRNAAERLNAILRAWGFESVFYHAGMSFEERFGLESKLANHPETRPIWVIATSAFGMGMDFPFLKNCIVFDPSFTLLSLAQAVGRVGRSGALASASVYWHENDFISLSTRMSDEDQLRRLKEVSTWSASEECPRLSLENYFNGG